MKPKELKVLTDDELRQKELTLKKGIFDLNYQRKMGRVEKPGQFKNTRKDIARILTILKEKESEHDGNNPKSK